MVVGGSVVCGVEVGESVAMDGVVTGAVVVGESVTMGEGDISRASVDANGVCVCGSIVCVGRLVIVVSVDVRGSSHVNRENAGISLVQTGPTSQSSTVGEKIQHVATGVPEPTWSGFTQESVSVLLRLTPLDAFTATVSKS